MAGAQKRVRSPKFPFIDLKTAIARAEAFYQCEKRNSASVPVAMQSWGYKVDSSGGFQTISTLKEFGLMEDFGSKDARRVKLTDRALRIILDKREDATERAKLIKEAALLPKIHNALWQQYQGELPSDSNLRHYLMFDYETPFNENSVGGFIDQFRSTLAFAKLTESDDISSEDEDSGEPGADHERPRVRVGDHVQWASQGVFQFPVPRRVRALSEDGEWAFVEGSNTGVPVKQLTLEQPPADTKKPPILPELKRAGVPPLQLGPGVRQDVFSLAEGPVTVQWPSMITKESYEDLADWLDILKRKIGRSVKQQNQVNSQAVIKSSPR